MRYFKVLKVTLLMFLFQSCVRYNSNLSEAYRNQITHYKKGQILIYKDKFEGIDSFKVVGLDSISISQGPSNLPLKEISLSIEHLPKNKWNSGILLRESTDKYDSIKNQNFISVSKLQASNNPSEDKYMLSIEYRDFSGEVNFDFLKSHKIDTLKTLRGKGLDTLKEDSVIEIFWHIDKGMIGYKKKNGSIYHLE